MMSGQTVPGGSQVPPDLTQVGPKEVPSPCQHMPLELRWDSLGAVKEKAADSHWAS